MKTLNFNAVINCGKTTCDKCQYVDYSEGTFFICSLFARPTPETKDRKPKRLKECIAAEAV